LKNNKHIREPSFLAIAASRPVVMRALKIAIIVGTLLALINHGDKIFSLSTSAQDWFKIALTYLIPYGVSTWSAVGVIKANIGKTTN
jgi:hypothetical protein